MEQAREHGVSAIALADVDSAERARGAWSGRVLATEEGVRELIVESGADLVLNGMVGAAGLGPTIVALSEGIDVALANKESLVIGGELTMALAEATGARILPVDSEHSALFQLIGAESPGTVERLVLTASGGPFRGRTDLAGVSVEDALAHPTWSMGGRITIDSATLMNKGFEAIEAHHLFGVPYERIEVVVHPQSIVHSLIDLNDGATLAHLGYPDMRVPISYALHFPERADVDVPRLDLSEVGELTFEQPDLETFACLRLALEAGEGGRDGALRAQRRRRGRGSGLPRRKDRLQRDRRRDRAVLAEMPAQPLTHFEDLFAVDAEARRRTEEQVGGWQPYELGLIFLGFSLLIILHEAGHFFAAKATGMRVEKFFLFFGPKLVSVKRGETEYGIAAIPAGGYVKISGMNPEDELPPGEEHRGYYEHAGLEADRRDRGGSGGQHRPRLRDPFRAGLWRQRSKPEGRRSHSGVSGRGVLKPGDRILAVDGKSYPNPDAKTRLERFFEAVGSHKCAGKQVDGCERGEARDAAGRSRWPGEDPLSDARVRTSGRADPGRFLLWHANRRISTLAVQLGGRAT